MTTSTDLAHALASGTRKIGALVYWRGLTDVRIPRDAMKTMFKACGLDEALKRDPKPEAVLNQAAGVAARRRGKDATAAKVELVAKHNFAVYAVLMSRPIGARARYLEEARITVARDQPRPMPAVTVAPDAPADDSRDDLIARTLAAYVDILDNALTQEVSEALIGAMDVVSSLPLRTGVYFVPERSLGPIRRLQAAMASWGVALTVWDIAGTDENIGEARSDARHAFMERVRSLAEECTAFAADRGEVNTKSVNARIKRFADLDGQVALYRDILGDITAELLASIDAARKTFVAQTIGESDQFQAA